MTLSGTIAMDRVAAAHDSKWYELYKLKNMITLLFSVLARVLKRDYYLRGRF